MPDPDSLEFIKEAQRQAAMLRGRPEELEALQFIAAVWESNWLAD